MIRFAISVIVAFAVFHFLPGLIPQVMSVAFTLSHTGITWLWLLVVVAFFLTYRATK